MRKTRWPHERLYSYYLRTRNDLKDSEQIEIARKVKNIGEFYVSKEEIIEIYLLYKECQKEIRRQLKESTLEKD